MNNLSSIYFFLMGFLLAINFVTPMFYLGIIARIGFITLCLMDLLIFKI